MLCVLRYSQRQPLSVRAQATLSPPHRFIRHIQFTFSFYHVKKRLSRVFQIFLFVNFCVLCKIEKNFYNLTNIYCKINKNHLVFILIFNNFPKNYFYFVYFFQVLVNCAKKQLKSFVKWCIMIMDIYGYRGSCAPK